ncbi:patched domain-containing protein 3-like [Ptychodera flava]|uniref:patched domain-containing protein 3-like n=1 Tax=Ptychodera flava TaxID=63121 RepID=UPI00396AA056
MAFDCIEKRLSRLLAQHGQFVASHFVWFIILPIIVSVILGLGALRLHQRTDIEYLFTPENGPAKKHRSEIERHFTVDYNGGFLPDRKTGVGRYSHALIVAKNDGNVLSGDTLEEVIKFHESVKNLTVTMDDKDYSYDDLCGKWKTECVDPNMLLRLVNYKSRNVDLMTLTYPVTVVQNTEYFIGSDLGGVELQNNSETMTTAKAMSLLYSLSSEELDDVSVKWEDAFVSKATELNSSKIDVRLITSRTLNQDFVDIVSFMLPLLVYAFFVLTSFAVISCTMLDWVASKPLLTVLGVISALLAVASSFGLLLFCGVPFNHLVIGMPFLTLGVGVDDMFIMIASWRSTSPHLSVRDRLGKTFSEAALSITITSITDALAFGIGAISNFPSVRIFCCYCGVAIVFDYIYQLTFFGGCMALIGRREKQNRHCVTFRKVVSKKEAPSTLYKLFCAGGVPKIPQNVDVNTSEHFVMRFFSEYYGPFITKKWCKVFTLFLYLGYISVAIFGCLQLSEGINPKQLALDDSYSVRYYDTQQKYFNEFGPIVQIVMTTPQNYSDVSVQTEIQRVLDELQSSFYFHRGSSHTTQCWLLEYLNFLNHTGLSYTAEDYFIYHLRNSFLKFPLYERYQLDLSFSLDNMAIESSRCLVTSRDIANATVERKRKFMHKAREIAESSWIPMLAYHPSFVFDDHFDAILPSTIQNILIAAVGMLLVSLLLIPQPICAVYVTVSIASIVIGVIGYMALWDVGLDFISMIIIVVCIGFSVDYSAHVTYAFVISPRDSRNERAIEGLHLLGLPILQSFISTVLAICLISTAETYAFRAIFKEMLLGMIFGALHGLLFLPVLLSTLGPLQPTRQSLDKIWRLNRTRGDVLPSPPHLTSGNTSNPLFIDGDVIDQTETSSQLPHAEETPSHVWSNYADIRFIDDDSTDTELAQSNHVQSRISQADPAQVPSSMQLDHGRIWRAATTNQHIGCQWPHANATEMYLGPNS